MTNRERLLKTLRGEAVDRPPVNFYELNGVDENPDDLDPYNIYTHPSWKPLLELTRAHTDRIVMRAVKPSYACNPLVELTRTDTRIDGNGVKTVVTEINAGTRILRGQAQREPDINTEWVVEHLLKDEADLLAWLSLPEPSGLTIDTTAIDAAEAALGDSGIVMLDIGDALCSVAELFAMEDYTVLALTEQVLFHRALEKAQAQLLQLVERVARAKPGYLWRIYGPEYASPPFLPPRLYNEYVVRYDKALIDIIHRSGGYARIHQHGNQRAILDFTMQTGCDALDPIEPPPQGDVDLAYVKERYGGQVVLFGNLEINDIELLPPHEFEGKIVTAMEEGMSGGGRGFVLMPSACPYGRVLSQRALENYCKIVEVAARYRY